MNEKFLNLREEKKESILQAAISEFAQEGYDRASTDNIVVKAKISKGSLFNYFINKQGLYEDIVNYIIAKAQKEVVEEFTKIKEEDFYGRLKRLLVIKHDYTMRYPLEAKVLKDYINANSTRDNAIVRKYREIEQALLQRHLITYLNIEEIRPGLTVEDVLFVTNTLLQAVLKRQDELASFDQTAGTKEVVEKELDKYIYLLKYGMYK
nr:TetR/AcrR family transcriptional regulator [uncultured Cellulosilyticum sp.]